MNQGTGMNSQLSLFWRHGLNHHARTVCEFPDLHEVRLPCFPNDSKDDRWKQQQLSEWNNAYLEPRHDGHICCVGPPPCEKGQLLDDRCDNKTANGHQNVAAKAGLAIPVSVAENNPSDQNNEDHEEAVCQAGKKTVPPPVLYSFHSNI